MNIRNKKIIQSVVAHIFLVLFLIAILLQPLSAALSGPVSDPEPAVETPDVVEEEPVAEPVEVKETVVEEVVPEVVEEEVEVEPTLLPYDYFDVPLDLELQEYIFMVCELYNMEPAIIIAMIEKESTYRVNCMGDNGRSYGLMQIQKRWHEQRMLDLGVEDLLDPYQNVSVGIDYFGELFGYEKGISWALMAYNGGVTYANRMEAAGRVSTYAEWVLNRSYELGWRVW